MIEAIHSDRIRFADVFMDMALSKSNRDLEVQFFV